MRYLTSLENSGMLATDTLRSNGSISIARMLGRRLFMQEVRRKRGRLSGSTCLRVDLAVHP
jgi:hypothetical protein